MRFLVDSQLSPVFADFMQQQGRDTIHLYDLAPEGANDRTVWELAAQMHRVIVTRDEDFAMRAKLQSGLPQVLWIRTNRCATSALCAWVAPRLHGIVQTLQLGERVVIAA